MEAELGKNDTPQIPQFYAGREVFITGATGFMGQVLIERLLTTCRDLRRLHLLVRMKGNSAEARLNELKQSKVFDVLRQNDPQQLDKLHLIPGDMTRSDLGISKESIAELDNVTLVFHLAATVRMDQPPDVAVKINTLATMVLLDICDGLPNLEAFVHVSTAFCHSECKVLEERVYPLPLPLDHMIEQCLNAKFTTEEEVNRFISPKRNTYVFTKTLAEAVVAEHGCKRYPLAIFRPTIVSGSVRDPIPGWCQGYGGVMGVLAPTAQGLQHVMYCRASNRADFLPVDIAIDTIIAVGWETVVDKLPEIRVYNCNTERNPTTWRDVRHHCINVMRETPANALLWYPSLLLFENRYALMIARFFLETIPLHLFECIMKIISKDKKRLNLITASKRLKNVQSLIGPFCFLEWSMVEDNVRKLAGRLSKSDAEILNLNPNTIVWEEYYKNFMRGVIKHVLKDEAAGSVAAKKHLQRLYYIHYWFILVVVACTLKYAILPLAATFTSMFLDF